MTETPDPQEQYLDPAFGGCDHLRDSRTCEDCAAEDRAIQSMRRTASALASRTASTLSVLDDLAVTLAAVTGDHFYREFYSDADADADALAALEDARRTMRSFARIARERAARTELNP
jgi:hypothetical protein